MRTFTQLILAVLLGLTWLGFDTLSSTTYPQDFFRWPIDHAVRVSGTFGELRSNHFHAGIDLKSRKGGVGDPILAAGEGYISRIKIEARGYGNALYLTHPNGFTTLYAHLNAYTPEVRDYIEAQQKKQKKFEVELFPDSNQFVFKKGEKIGEMGTTGSSFGPHLHWEIRETESEKAINPLLFGLKMKDSRPPSMQQLRIYERDPSGLEKKQKTYGLQRKGSGYGVSGDTILVHSNLVGVAVKSYDHHDDVRNWNGLFGINMELDDSLVYQLEMNSIAFDETRFINAHLDYADEVTNRSYFNRCFVLPGNDLSMYGALVDRGLIRLEPGVPRKVRVAVSDALQNSTYCEVWIKQVEDAGFALPDHQYYLLHDEENVIQTEDCRAHFFQQTFYEDLPFQFASSADGSREYYSRVLHLHNYKVPVHRFFELGIKPNRKMDSLTRSKAMIAYCDPRGRVLNCGGTWENGYLKAMVRDLGDFSIMVDQEAPTIRPVGFRSNMRGRKTMRFVASDNYAVVREIDPLIYNAYLDGEWVVVEYDKKNNLLIHRFAEDLERGTHTFRLEVADVLGNTRVWEQSFRY